ncbi:ABC transporter permease subunit [Bacillus spongiae]|uniref:ABC transporter permease subunit n=1 Tax=Bacillus spongiae TaxID=2683610 RepID=A0ABU8HGL0_9BACI
MSRLLKKIVDKSFQLLFACVGIILVGALPNLLSGLSSWQLNWSMYFESVLEITSALFHLDEITYHGRDPSAVRPLFPLIIEPLSYSLTLLLGAFLVAVIVSLLLTYITMLFTERNRRKIKMIFFLFESLPDIFIILMCQMFVVFFYKKTQILLVEFAAVGPTKAYLLPILCLSILPMIHLFRLSMLTFENEERQNYVELAKSIGNGKTIIFTKHMFRNAIISVFFQSKKIIWFMLSNLFVLEILFNVPGITWFLFQNMQPKVTTVTLIAIFIPVFIFYTIGEWLIERKAGKGEVLT